MAPMPLEVPRAGADNGRGPFVPRSLPLISRLLLACLLVCAAPGCGLLTRDVPLGFRTYTLQDVDYAESLDLVHEALRKFAVTRFGGVGITVDAAEGNIELDPVYEGRRRMWLYLQLLPRPPHVDLEMLALVEHLQTGEGGGAVGWTRPMMDVPLEEAVYQAVLVELLERRAAAPAP
jgi:hypothetical protein